MVLKKIRHKSVVQNLKESRELGQRSFEIFLITGFTRMTIPSLQRGRKKQGGSYLIIVYKMEKEFYCLLTHLSVL